MTFPHGICYGLKWLLRQEGPRDHLDMVKSLAVLPNIIVCDIANMIVAHGQIAEEFQRGVDEQSLHNPVTQSCEHFSLFDPFHEKNTVNPADSLRRVSCVRQLGGKMNLETAEQLNNRRNRDNYFTTSLTPHNAVFIERLVAHFTNQKLNNRIYDAHTRQVYRHAI